MFTIRYDDTPRYAMPYVYASCTGYALCRRATADSRCHIRHAALSFRFIFAYATRDAAALMLRFRCCDMRRALCHADYAASEMLTPLRARCHAAADATCHYA